MRFDGQTSGAKLDRRTFLRTGAAAAGAIMIGTQVASAMPPANDKSCIVLFLTGGPSHLDTWDLKPEAPDTIRGPFRPIQTSVPGIQICEHFPRMARLADKYAIIRSVYHDARPIHETGQQLLQTGHMVESMDDAPNLGAVRSATGPASTGNLRRWVITPTPLGNTGVAIGHGQSAGRLGGQHAAVEVSAHPSSVRPPFPPEFRKHGASLFGLSCCCLPRLVERGCRFVTVNMFDTVFNETTWDCHADGGALATTLEDYKNILCPMFDAAYSALLEDLSARGLLEETLVVAMGEFGRTPRLNRNGGRDHWTRCWSILLAGGGVRGGQVIGASDRHGAEPAERPVHAAEIAATIAEVLGIREQAGIEAMPVHELF
jgi:hypothetical protein